MIDLEFDVLDKLYRAPQHTLTISDLSKEFKGRVNDMSYVVANLKSQKLVSQSTNSEFVSLTHPDGTIAYLTESHKRTDHKRAKRRDWIYAAIGALIAGLVGFLFDLLVLVLG